MHRKSRNCTRRPAMNWSERNHNPNPENIFDELSGSFEWSEYHSTTAEVKSLFPKSTLIEGRMENAPRLISPHSPFLSGPTLLEKQWPPHPPSCIGRRTNWRTKSEAPRRCSTPSLVSLQSAAPMRLIMEIGFYGTSFNMTLYRPFWLIALNPLRLWVLLVFDAGRCPILEFNHFHWRICIWFVQ